MKCGCLKEPAGGPVKERKQDASVAISVLLHMSPAQMLALVSSGISVYVCKACKIGHRHQRTQDVL